MIHFSVDQPSLERLKAKLTPALYTDSVKEVFREAAASVQRDIQSSETRDIAAIARSFLTDVQPLGARVYSLNPGALAVEFGRKPGTPMPAEALTAWAARHGLSGLEFPIARAIQRRGIKGRFFMRRALDRLVSSELPQLLRKAIGEIEQRWRR
jgi:hypothetical protein